MELELALHLAAAAVAGGAIAYLAWAKAARARAEELTKRCAEAEKNAETARKERVEAEKAKEAAVRARDQLEATLKAAPAREKELAKRCAEAKKNAETARYERVEAERAREAAEKARVELEATLTAARARADELAERGTVAEKKAEAARKERKQADARSEAAEKARAEAEATLKAARATAEDSEKRCTAAENRTETAREELKHAETAREAAVTARVELEAMLKAARARAEELANRCLDAEKKAEAARKERVEAEKAREAAETARAEAEATLKAARATAEDSEKRCTAAENRTETAREELKQAETAREAAEKATGELRVTLKEERESRRKHEEQVEKRLNQNFAELAKEALGSNSKQFLQLVTERFKTHEGEAKKDLQGRQTAIENLVKPIRKSLSDFDKQVTEIEKQREGAYRAITEQVKNLKEGQKGVQTETRRLAQALRRPKTRGNWGEFHLHTVLEMSGMKEHVDFLSEETVKGWHGKQRPDVIVRMPGAKTIVIDSKTPLDGYLTAHEAGYDDQKREDSLNRHAEHVLKHVDKLSSKEYWAALPGSPDFVIMFLPGEALLDAAARMKPGIFESALKDRVLIATPTTLIALLKAVAYGWQQESVSENARNVAELGRDLHRLLWRFCDYMQKMGKSLRQAVQHYDKGVGSLESSVLKEARKFEGLGAAPEGKKIPRLEPLDLEPRRLESIDLAAEAD